LGRQPTDVDPMRLAVPTLLLLAFSHAHAQQQISGIDGRLLRTGVDSLAIYVVRGNDTTRTGMLWDQLETVEIGGRPALQRVYRTEDRYLGTRLDTIVDELPTLAPIRSWSGSGHMLESLDFGAGRVRGWMRVGNRDSVSLDAEISGTTYNSATFDLLVRAAPLRDGWRAKVPAFLAMTRGVVSLTAQVAGMDRIGTGTCWRVDAVFTGMPVTFWVDQESRRLCQQVMHLQTGIKILFTAPLPAPSSKRAA
jgi:hypothetical protein